MCRKTRKQKIFFRFCKGNWTGQEILVKDMVELGLTGHGLKNILECSRSGQGMKCFVYFFYENGINIKNMKNKILYTGSK